MFDEEFLKSMLLYFYKNTKYDPIRINITICYELYEKVVELYPESRHRQNMLENKSVVDNFNGMSFPCENLKDGYNVVISKKVFELDWYTYFGPFQHEFTHAHDLDVLARYINATTAEKLMEYEYYDNAMNVISEFNARRNGFLSVRNLVYNFEDEESEKAHIFEKEVPLIKSYMKSEMTLYDVAQLMGRMAVLDMKTERQVSQYFLEKAVHLYDAETFYTFNRLYEVLFEHMNEKDNIKKCMMDVVNILSGGSMT